MKRIFLAFDINSEVKSILQHRQIQLENALKTKSSCIKWVNPSLYHLTVLFVGSIPDKLVVDIRNYIIKYSSKLHAINVTLQNIDFFGRKNEISVVYNKIEGNFVETKQFAKRLSGFLDLKNVNKTGFNPHITLGRIKKNNHLRKMDFIELSDEISITENVNFWINKIIIYESILSSVGPTYFPLFTLNLEYN